MCIAALPLLGMIASIGQAAVGFMAASQQAAEQNAYHEANRKAAVAAASDKYASQQNRILQEREAASQELFEKQITAMKARATAVTSAGEAGVTGLSVDALENDLLAQQGRQMQAIQTNWDIKQAHQADEMQSTYHQTVARINSVRKAVAPSPLGFIFQAIGGAAKGMA
jgi:hypothetical protein